MNASGQVRRARHIAVAEALRQAITSGEHPPGSLLPSETTLAATFGVGRSTIRMAISTLRMEGLVKPEHGRGTVVCQPVAPTVDERTDADPAAELTMLGEPLHLMQQADPDLAAILGTNRNHPLYVVTQAARTRSGRPVHTRRLLPMRAIAGTPLEDEPFPPRAHLLKTLAELHGVTSTSERIRFRDPENPDEATALDIPPTGSVAETIRITRAGGLPVLAEIQRTNARSAEFEYRLG